MKSVVIIDNTGTDDIAGEWGLCIYTEYNGKKILLDTGASNLFEENAKKLGISLEDVDAAVLSHAHYDHANGMERFFEINKKAGFYLQDGTTDNCYYKNWIFKRYIGIPKGITERFADRIRFVSGKYEIFDGVYVLAHTTPGLGAIGKREKMYQRQGKKYVPDNFCHEQSLIFDTEKGLVIFNSCSHGGADSIINEVSKAFPGKKVHALIGGFHIYKRTEDEIRELASRIRETGIQYVCTGHCSKQRGFDILRRELGDIVHQFSVGLELEF